MPIYEYRCVSCGNVFEELVSGNRDQSVPCPTCGPVKTEKIMSAIGGIATAGGSSCPSTGIPCASSGACAAGGGCGCLNPQ